MFVNFSMHSKIFIILLAIIGLYDCSATENPKVEIYGALFEMMHQGNLSTRIDLNSLEGKKHTYGLGALTDLKGEILIMDSNVFISSETNNVILIYQTVIIIKLHYLYNPR